jgi:alcohol dehydrogenase class IV
MMAVQTNIQNRQCDKFNESAAQQISFVHQSLRTRVIAKAGAVAELGKELAKFGCRRPLLLASGRTAAGTVYSEAVQALDGMTFFEVSDIPQHSSIAVVTKVAQLAAQRSVDMQEVAHAPGSMEARAKLLLAAHVSGMVLASARSCLHHAICHVLGATYAVAHGAVNSVILPHAVRFNAPYAIKELSAAAHQLGVAGASDDPVESLIDWIHSMQRITGVPSRLRDLGIDRAQLHTITVKTSHERGLAYNPRPLTAPAEIESILAAAW